jgi:hypothetical protein
MKTHSERFLVRFAIGDRQGVRSSVWRIWKARKTDDIYIAPRPMVSIAKASLHVSGLCYFSITTEHHRQMIAAGTAREKRALTRWKRPPTPPAGLVSALSILFAAEFLSQKSTPVDSDPILIDIPKAGKAIVIDLVFGRMPDGRLGLQPNQKELGHIFLSTGEEFFVIAGLVKDFDANTFRRQHQPLSQNMDSTFLQQPAYDGDPDNLRGAILLPAISDGVLRIVEVGPAYIDSTVTDEAVGTLLAGRRACRGVNVGCSFLFPL